MIEYREVLPKPRVKLNVIKYDDGSVESFTNQNIYFDTLRKRSDICDYYSIHFYDSFGGQENVVSVRRKGSNAYFTINSRNTYLVYQPLQSMHKKRAIWIEEKDNSYLDEYYGILEQNNIFVTNNYKDKDGFINNIKRKIKH